MMIGPAALEQSEESEMSNHRFDRAYCAASDNAGDQRLNGVLKMLTRIVWPALGLIGVDPIKKAPHWPFPPVGDLKVVQKVLAKLETTRPTLTKISSGFDDEPRANSKLSIRPSDRKDVNHLLIQQVSIVNR